MFRTILCLTALCLALVTPRAQANEAVTIAGPWIVTFTIAGESLSVRATLNQEGNVITGQLQEDKLNGTFKEGQIEMTMSNAKGAQQGKLNGVFRDGKFSGSGMLWGHTLESWAAYRPASAPSSPQTHTFDPSAYPRYISSDVKPALRVFSGDTVRTKLVDEDGRDETGKTRALSGIPVVGPFYVENALPGDMLAIRLNKIRLNRDSAKGGHRFAATTVDPDYLRYAKEPNVDANWKLDRTTGTARLAKPTAGLTSLAVPIQPLIGIIGVAPAGRQIVLAKGGGDNFGGQLDYNEIVEGTTVYLPVFHEGAGLFIGDGQALQGDGRISGEGLETSVDVEFTVTVVPRKAFHIPYAENATDLMFIGVGGSVEQALQRATTGLAGYLEREFKLNAAEVATVLGVAAQFRIAKVASARNEQSTVVAKISKTVLQQLSNAAPKTP